MRFLSGDCRKYVIAHKRKKKIFLLKALSRTKQKAAVNLIELFRNVDVIYSVSDKQLIPC